jgi:hypothetical protein
VTRFHLVTLLFFISLVPSGLYSADEKPVDFARDVLPVLSDKCFVCHGPDTKDKDQLRLDSAAGATADRSGYKAVDTKEPEKSELLARILSKEEPMPPADAEKQLTEKERDLLANWIRQGGVYAEHWAFVAPKKAAPGGEEKAKGSAAIDAFLREPLKEQKLDLAPEADPETLARRAALVLTGLPPDLHLLNRFLENTSPHAYSLYLDELLASPRFGEHQAHFWLDAVRYGDTHGLHLDNRRGIYPYRDWVVRAMNQNLPLDEFIEWQLAGDLMESPSIAQQVATGYVRLNPSTGEGGAIPAEFQMKNNFDRVETLGTVFLGLSLTCARCHNHKYDPVAQREYYGLLAFFNSTSEPALDGNKYEYGPTVRAPKDQSGWAAWEQILSERNRMLKNAETHFARNKDWPEETKKQWVAADAAAKVKLLADEKSPLAKLGHVERAARIQKRISNAQAAFTTSLVAKDLGTPRATHVLRRGEYDQPLGDALQPDVPRIMGTLPEDVPRNRIGLAKWLTSREHPLVARVLVNRIWQRVFGAGLVRTPEDFGRQGQQPTHPELLDWLAVELHESQWNLKHILKLMVTSQAFRQSSARRKDVNDPENRLFARGPGHRLDAEVLRDVGLMASGLLDPHMGGEGVKPYQPAGLWKALAHPGSNTKQYVADKGERLYRRSLYVYWKRTSPHPMMILFDAPDRESSCVRRSRTSTAQQSLALLNEIQRIEMSRKFAERLLKQADSDDARFDLMFRLLASRVPSDDERTACRTLLDFMRNRYADAEQDALDLLATGEAKRDESLKPTELAAWTQVAVTVLASDVSILLY